LVLSSALLATLTACGFPKTGPVPGAVSPAEVTAATAKWPNATEAQLTSGRDAFVARCNHCHGYPDVGSVPEGEWPAIIDRMGNKASLDASQKDAVLRFILVARSTPGA
jgi:hypothetical protein